MQASRGLWMAGAVAVAVCPLVGCDVIIGLDSYEVEKPDMEPGAPQGGDSSAVEPRQNGLNSDDRSPGSGETSGADTRAAGGSDAPASGAGRSVPPSTPEPEAPPSTPPSEGPPGNVTGPQPTPPSVGVAAPADLSCGDSQSSFDILYQEVAADLFRLDAADALAARYLSLTNREGSSACANSSLDGERQALFKMVNALSTGAIVRQPIAIDAAESIYRIDLADYGWDQPVTVVNADGSITDFVDRWEAIVGHNPYAVPFVGDDAEDTVRLSGTAVPVMSADSVLDVATVGNLYYALIGVNVQDTLDNFILNELQIDVAQNAIDELQRRAGTTRSTLTPRDRMLQRDTIESRQGVLWQAFDFDDTDSIFENPFGFAQLGSEAIFTLPNGLLGFAIADASSRLVEQVELDIDGNQQNFVAINSISCSDCHAQGLISAVDEVKDIVLANAPGIGLTREEIGQVQSVFPPPAEFAALVEADSDLYRGALSQAGVSLTGRDPITHVFLRFDQDVNLVDAAGDLGLSAQELDDNLNLLEPELGVLRGGTLDREVFTQFYVASLCVLQQVGDNQPDPNLCDQVFADLGIVQ